MKFLIVLALFTTTAFASTAKFEMGLSVKSLSTDEVIAVIDCQVTQTLTWENSSNFFRCTNESGEMFSLMNVAVTIGYHHDLRQAYTIHETVGKKGLISGLFEKMGIETKVVRGAGIKIYYRDNSPTATREEYMLEGIDDAFSVVIDKINYIQ